jgi:hypothetical protein
VPWPYVSAHFSSASHSPAATLLIIGMYHLVFLFTDVYFLF